MNGVSRCPVCEGRGTMPVEFYAGGLADATGPREVCRSCGGRGIVWDVGYLLAPIEVAPASPQTPLVPVTVALYAAWSDVETHP